MTFDDMSVDRDPTARPNDYDFSWKNSLRVYFNNLIATKHAGRLRKKGQHVLNGAPTTAYGQAFKNFRCEYEYHNDQGSEEFTDSQRRDKCDGHGKLHRHSSLYDVFEGLFEDRVTPDQCGH